MENGHDVDPGAAVVVQVAGGESHSLALTGALLVSLLLQVLLLYSCTYSYTTFFTLLQVRRRRN